MNLPNKLTIGRIVMAVVIIAILLFPFDSMGISTTKFFINEILVVDIKYLIAGVLFVLASFTDFLDGYIARKYNLITKFGTAMDPLADKLMLLAALASLGIKGFLPVWLVVLMFVKEAIMILVGLYMYFRKEKYVVPANKFGKIATLVFSIAIMAILFAPEVEELVYLVYVALILKIVAFSSYAIHHSKNIRNLK